MGTKRCPRKTLQAEATAATRELIEHTSCHFSCLRDPNGNTLPEDRI